MRPWRALLGAPWRSSPKHSVAQNQTLRLRRLAAVKGAETATIGAPMPPEGFAGDGLCHTWGGTAAEIIVVRYVPHAVMIVGRCEPSIWPLVPKALPMRG